MNAATRVRKNHLALSDEDRRRFVRAVLELKRTGVYDRFVAMHIRVNSMDLLDMNSGRRLGHLSPGLLAWHRQLLLEFENALRELDPGVTVPYWDWTTDQAPDSPLWSGAFMGGDGRPGDGRVMTGPFARDNGWVLNLSVVPVGGSFMSGTYTQDNRDFLVRQFGRRVPRLPTPEELADVLVLPVYDCPPWDGRSGSAAPFDSFRNHLEGWVALPGQPRPPRLHNCVHAWVGGHMSYVGSVNDPLFFLHHCFLDRCWAIWQEQHPEVPHYLPLADGLEVPGLHTLLDPWRTMTPAELLDHRRFYRYDA